MLPADGRGLEGRPEPGLPVLVYSSGTEWPGPGSLTSAGMHEPQAIPRTPSPPARAHTVLQPLPSYCPRL